MKTSKFNFKKHQNFSKSWKMMIRFSVYTLVITLLIYLIFSTNNSSEKTMNEQEIEQINIEIDDVEMD